jgi:Flp pilus assembly protein TadD
LLGEAWYRGPIVLSWRDVLAGGRDETGGRNLVFHEFAHYVDALDGDVDGTPPLVGRERQRTWFRVTEAEYLRLVGQARRDEVSLLDHYGATNRAEFFAVATECFFEQPRAMWKQHRQLYRVLRDFYRQHPARWLPDAVTRVSVESQRVRSGSTARDKSKIQRSRQERLAVLQSGKPDELFTLAVQYFNDERYALAAATATRVIALSPRDGEAFVHRALARIKLGRYKAALADADTALHHDPTDPEAYVARGAAYLALRAFEDAKVNLDRALELGHNDAELRYYRGRAWMGLGQPARAVADFDRSLVMRPLVADVYYHSGLARRAMGDEAGANADLAKAFQLDPKVDRRNSKEETS